MQDSEREQGRLSERLSRGAPLAAIVLVLVVAGLLVAYQLLTILQLIAIAMLVALVLRSAVNGLETLGAPTWLAVLIMLAGLGATGALVWLVIIPNLVREVTILVSEGPGSLEALANVLREVPVVPALPQIVERLENSLSQLVGSIPSLAFTTATVLAGIVGTLFLALYFAVSPDTYISGILRLVPRERREGVKRFVDVLGSTLRGWIVGTILVSIFVGAGAGLGLWLLGVPLPLTFGIIAGILNVIPYLGSIVGGLLPAILALTISPVKALLVVVLFVILNQVEGNILRPLIMGRQIELPPGAVLVSILIFGSLLGPIIGALLAVPAAVVVKVLVDELSEDESSQEDKGEAEEKSSSGSTRS